ncbi:DegT/DnrJ/EryC1/StrS family aminotransferase [Cecembia lonarensis]|uniref:UDP-4-amino-4-deoxy-L-arabinose--oxoglutarate aminotransferase n=1 Tax=Cecembia lonarensis (strain CCUG 58316 / KCTC 22772 / LW9) TaxID=1225176 RepID=K1LDZ2_CECL9|nr:DegT/DnrJ/EryC1/StrS family aminotransferase [Cecembia lonarensis]EKB48608.1 UDP-4-amino-4-deoxy-L-arabinose--oxoglutarate aminotransferase [Cecembia lonarensis LW9]
MEIKMVDLKSQYLKIKNEIDEGIQKVIDTTSFIKGPAVQEFQLGLEKYLNVRHVIPCGNGTDALQIAMMALDLKPGDEVITASFTYVATAEVIALLGLKPVLVDVDRDSFLIRPDEIEAAITPKTRAIVPIHLFGQCADMEAILEIAKKHNLYVIEDTAQAMGAEFTFSDGTVKKAGCMGDIGCTSFFPSKNLGCYGDGGAMYTDDEILAKKLRMIANHGQSIQYHHDIIGVNSRLDAIQAAILNAKLPYLDTYNGSRQKAALFYDKAFSSCKKVKTPIRVSNSTHVFHQYTLQLAEDVDRNKLRQYLTEKGIPSMVYYPVPLHRQKAYMDEFNKDEKFPISNYLSGCVLSLPMHTELSENQLNYIAETILSFFE